MYTKYGIVEDYRFFFHAFVIFKIAKLVHNCPDASSFTLPAPYRSSRCKVIVIGCKSASFRGAKSGTYCSKSGTYRAKIGAFVMILRPLVSRRNQGDTRQFFAPWAGNNFSPVREQLSALMVQEIYSQGGLVTVVTVQNAVR